VNIEAKRKESLSIYRYPQRTKKRTAFAFFNPVDMKYISLTKELGSWKVREKEKKKVAPSSLSKELSRVQCE